MKSKLLASLDPDLALASAPEPFRTTPEEQRKIIAERLAGVQVKDIAKRFNVHEATVWRICKQSLEDAKQASGEWRASFDRLTPLAVEAVEIALKDRTDNYKSATIGQKHLSGTGVYAPDTNVQVATVLQTMPADLKSLVDSETFEFSSGTTPSGLPDNDASIISGRS